MEPASTAWTDEELMALPKDGHKHELINGEIIMSPTGYRHEDIAAAVLTAMRLHGRHQKLGSVCGSSLGCWMASGNLLSPDVSFIHKTRIPRGEDAVKRCFQGSPDLVVEILSPCDRTIRTHDKMVEYFASGARLAWVINPEGKSCPRLSGARSRPPPAPDRHPRRRRRAPRLPPPAGRVVRRAFVRLIRRPRCQLASLNRRRRCAALL